MVRWCSAWAARAGFIRNGPAPSRGPGAPGGRADAWSVPGELGDGFLGAGVVGEVLARGDGGDERGDGGVVEGPGQPVGDAVQPGDRVVGAQGILAAGAGAGGAPAVRCFGE